MSEQQPDTDEANIRTREHVAYWLSASTLAPSDIDCVNAVMLKILDGKCKMPVVEKQVMAELYRQLRGRGGLRLSVGLHELVDQADEHLDDSMRARIYEQRVLAETVIARPVMKAFKAMIRRTGLL